MISQLPEHVQGLGLALSPRQIEQLTGYRELLASASRDFNLTSLRDREAIERRHIVESLAFGALLSRYGLLEGGLSVVDIGTGAGLPGIPLKIAWPSLRMVLLESVGKKCRFLEAVVESLGLADVTVVEGRAEELGRHAAHRETHDLVIARAVAPLPVLLEYALPLLRVGGWLAAPKGSAALREIDDSAAALVALGGRLHDAAPFRPPEGLSQTVALIEKMRSTDDRYPRRSGIPSKRPL